MEIHGNTIIQVALLESFGRRYYDVPHGTRIYAWGTKRFRNRFFGGDKGGVNRITRGENWKQQK